MILMLYCQFLKELKIELMWIVYFYLILLLTRIYFIKMDADSECVSMFNEKLDFFISQLQAAKNVSGTSIYDTCTKLRKVFPDFSAPELDKTEKFIGTNTRYA